MLLYERVWQLVVRLVRILVKSIKIAMGTVKYTLLSVCELIHLR
jgi:hypothetical protein